MNLCANSSAAEVESCSVAVKVGESARWLLQLSRVVVVVVVVVHRRVWGLDFIEREKVKGTIITSAFEAKRQQ